MEYPPCPNNSQNLGCERSDPAVLDDTSEVYGFKCRTCGTPYVYSKGNFKNKVAYDKKLEDKVEMDKKFRSFDSRPKHFI